MAPRRLRLGRSLFLATCLVALAAASAAQAADRPLAPPPAPAAAASMESCPAAAPEVLWLAIDLSCGACSEPACIGKKAGDSCGFSGQKCGALLPRCSQDNRFRCTCQTP